MITWCVKMSPLSMLYWRCVTANTGWLTSLKYYRTIWRFVFLCSLVFWHVFKFRDPYLSTWILYRVDITLTLKSSSLHCLFLTNHCRWHCVLRVLLLQRAPILLSRLRNRWKKLHVHRTHLHRYIHLHHLMFTFTACLSLVLATKWAHCRGNVLSIRSNNS